MDVGICIGHLSWAFVMDVCDGRGRWSWALGHLSWAYVMGVCHGRLSCVMLWAISGEFFFLNCAILELFFKFDPRTRRRTF